jgi:hypothetical protein
MRRISAGRDELLAIGDNPATDREGARRMGVICVLVGSDPGAHFQNLAEMVGSSQPPKGSEGVPGGRLRRPEFLAIVAPVPSEPRNRTLMAAGEGNSASTASHRCHRGAR